MSIDPRAPLDAAAEQPPDPEEVQPGTDSADAEEYDPPPVVDPDKEATEADVVDQAIEVELDDAEDGAEPV